MLDVHPPHEPTHTWRDFFVHIATIVVGLLIAVALEQSVEWLHHRHQRHTAERNLAVERAQNRKTLAEDEKQLMLSVKQLRVGLDAVGALRAHKPPEHSLAAEWTWDDLTSSAWDTARATDAAALMPYDEAQRYADIYHQQEIVNAESSEYIRDVYRVGAPLQAGRKPEQLTAADLDKMEADIELAITDANHLLDLCRGLDSMYRSDSQAAE